MAIKKRKIPLIGKCPVCKSKTQYDGVDCTACGFNGANYSVEQYKALIKRSESKAKPRKKASPSPDSAAPTERRQRQPRKLKAKAERKRFKIRVFKRADPRLLTPEEVTSLKNKADEEQSVFAARRIARDTVRAVEARIRKSKFTFEMARWKMINTVREELVDILK